ncbi:hypothetical protein LTR56_026036 [Elasticomyces elasticus]|nr:hypothetical protein LTR56_026036 [Elasticomyces elasticus]KAK3620066.1 hypothetical protein LTR22_025744 [Elasticomyces elasticus]KAK4905001.1 hypothetical protein LTR49_025648 [Elasticomyces elasticus]KAK5738869.1 hypothetical protein LTS12_025461 [Elasticomyces elasticus]
MIDHVLGRPSPSLRKYQVSLVLLFWTAYAARSDPHGPKPFRRLSDYLSTRLTFWRSFLLFSLSLYLSRNFARVVGLESPEPLANLYKRSYFRATWVTTALDAGFWTAMHLRPKPVKDLASVLFTLYYLVCAEQADEMVRRVRGSLTLQHLRISWDKPNTPYIAAFTNLMRPKLMHYKPRRITIPRPASSAYTEPIQAWLYFDGPREQLRHHDKLVLDIPGGGFVAMDPRCHDDKLMAWAGKLGRPVLALDYKKAPEYPYPYALNECYDAYHTLTTTRGVGLGFPGDKVPSIIVSGDSAGGNLAVGLCCLLLSEDGHRGNTPVPPPEALVLVYPALDMNIRNWMTDEQMALIKAPERRKRKENKMVLTRKSEDYRRLTPHTPYGSGDEGESSPPKSPTSSTLQRTASVMGSGKWLNGAPTTSSPIATTPHDTSLDPQPAPKLRRQLTAPPTSSLPTRLAMTSMISYFSDRILSPEMLRAMIILYIGPHNKPDFATDHLLSPILCPEAILARFPKTYMLTGERDPLVDDTVVFAGRLRQAKEIRWRERKELGLVPEKEEFDESRVVEVVLVPGVSHGFLQFVSVFPEGREYIDQCRRWMKEVFAKVDERERDETPFQTPYQTPVEERKGSGYFGNGDVRRHQRRREAGGEGGKDGAGSDSGEDRPLEMSARFGMTPINTSGDSRRGSKAKPASGRGNIKKGKPAFSGRMSPLATRRSLVRLGSTEDLMGRRMHGLTGRLMGSGQEPFTP